MLAKLARTIPEGDGWLFEPKWDGFRCIVFRDGDDIELASRNERPFTRYFPELLEPLRAALPAALRRRRRDRRRRPTTATGSTSTPCCSASTRPSRGSAASPPRRPASFIAFDLLALGDDVAARRAARRAPRAAARACVRPAPPVHLTPASTDRRDRRASGSVEFEGAGLDGVVAKRLDDPYTPDKRALVKVKHERTADCVVAGYRIHKDGNGVGSLLLGLYDDDGPAAPRRRRRVVHASSAAPSCSPSSSR